MNSHILPLSLKEGLARYKANKVQPKGFNLFCSMFNWHNERYLHSSFIGMMLSMKQEFLVLFLEELHRADAGAGVFKADDLAYFKGCTCKIYPNKDEHGEWRNIDILIRTADKKRAVVIENKILANDRMVNGKHQLEMYMERVREDGAERVIGVYLTPRRYQPDFAELWTEQNRMTLGYDTAIKHWAENCWKLEVDGFKREMIRQYGELLDVALNDPQVALEFREAVAANWEVAYDLYCSKDADRDFREAMKHVKWHTQYDVLNGVSDRLKALEGVEWNMENDRKMQKDVDVVSLTDKSSSLLVYNFRYKGIWCYICNDAKGFTIGPCNNRDGYQELDNRDLRNFRREETFQLIEPTCREELIQKVVDEAKAYLAGLS